MVFESLVVEILNRVLGDYVENLDSKQLSIGIWGGDVVLQNLMLKPKALEDLNLPIQTVYGRLGKLVLKIPWKNLYGAPVEAAIERLFLLVVPNQEVKYDPVKEEKSAQDSKQADLLRIETAKKKAAEQGQKRADDSFAEKLTTQIIKNVQVKIKDIHIRYEDKTTNPERPFAFGITLSNLSVETTNADWKAAIVSDAISKIHKVLNLDALAVYWNCHCPTYSDMPVADILKYFQDGIATRDTNPDGFLYMLGPINSSARLRLNPKPENDKEEFSMSKILLNLEMEKLAIGISKCQYIDIMLFAETMERMSLGLPYRKYRPFLHKYRGHYREWWHFAYNCILEELVRRRRRNWDWTHIAKHRAICREYAEAYQTMLINKKVTPDLKKVLIQCENALDVFNLVIIRQRIEMEVQRLEQKTERLKKKGSWFGGWFGKAAQDEDKELSTAADIMKKFEAAMTIDEKSKLYRAIDYQENSAPAEYPEAFVATSCAFLLRCLEIDIRDDTLKIPRVLNIRLDGVNCALNQRPAGKALQVAIKIDQFSAFGLQQNEIIPNLVTSDNFSEGNVLLDVFFEINPLDKTCGQRIHVNAQPLRVIYDAQTIIRIVEVFKGPESITLDQLSAAAGNKLADFKEMSATGMQHAVDQHVIMDLDINFSAPYIVVPYSGLYNPSQAALVVNLGHLKVKSILRQPSSLNIKKMHREGTGEDEILKEVMSQSYDKFLCELTDMQVLIANANEDWRTCIAEKTITSMHLLQPMSVTVGISKCLVSDDPRLPKLKVAGQLPEIMLNINDDRLLSIIKLISSIPLPINDSIKPGPLDSVVAKSSYLSIKEIANVPEKKNDKEGTSELEFAQATNLDVKFELKELVLTISRQLVADETTAPEKILQFRCILLELDMIQQTFNLDVIMRLGGIGLTQYRSRKEQIDIISTPMTIGQDEYLFSVQFLQVDKKSPEFHSRFGSTEQRLVLNFTTLQIQLHQQGLTALLKITSKFQAKLAEVTNTDPEKDRVATAKSKSTKLSTINEEFAAVKHIRNINTPTRKSRKILVETILFKFTADMGELDLLIANDTCRLASLSIRGVKTDIIIKKSYTQITAILTDIALLDANPETRHPKILCKTGTDNAIDAQIVMYNKTKVTDHSEIDMLISVTMSGLKITFLNLFVSNIHNFLNNFQAAQQAIIDASAAAAETAKLNMQNVYENATRLELKIKLKAPEIIIPTNSQSYDAIMLDLGNIILSNRFLTLTVKSETGQSAIVDDIKLNLMDIKLSRVLLDEQLNKRAECILLNPLSFVLRVKRNLSVSWYSLIPDLDIAGEMKAIEFSLSELDYGKIMSILNENIAEKCEPDERILIKKPSIKSDIGLSRPFSRTDSLVVSKSFPVIYYSTKRVHTFLRFSFTMDSLVINLFRGGAKTLAKDETLCHNPADGLARFTMLVLSVKGRILTDNSVSTSILLVDCMLDDTRSGREGKLTRLMERKEEAPDDICDATTDVTAADHTQRSMIDVTYQQKGTDMFIDVRVYSINLILSVDYLMKVAAFFSPPEIVELKANKTVKSMQDKTTNLKVQLAQQNMPSVENSITINLKMEKPDIILVEQMNNIDTNALILNNEVLLNVRLAGENKSIRGSISDLQLYTCCYNPARRHETKCSVLRPCNIIVIGATPENQGLHLEVTLSDIRLSVSPAIIDLLSKIQATMTAPEVEVVVDKYAASTIYSDIWEQKPLKDSEYWFLKTEVATEAIEGLPGASVEEFPIRILNEKCSISALSFIVTVEAGVGHKTLPMLLLETGFEASVCNWSSMMYIDASLSVQMAYYNSRLAVWEPLIEPVETNLDNRLIYTPWELKIELKMNDQEPAITSPLVEDVDSIEEVIFTPPSQSIHIFSNVNLELVVTKTLLEVLTQLGKAFASAVKEGVLLKEDSTSPYKVVNESGLDVTLLLENTVFQICSNPIVSCGYQEILLENGAEIPLELKPDQHSIVSLQLGKSSSAYNSLDEVTEKDIIVLVNKMNCTLTLPLVRADKRFFPLNFRGDSNDSWGIVSDVTVQGAEIVLTLRSMLQVYNHFNKPVDVFFMTNAGNVLEFIKKVPPESFINLPVQAVYTLTNELFFSIEGHCVSTIPFVWKELQHNLSVMKVLPLPSGIKPGQALVIKVCGDIEQIFYENTMRYTMASTCYNIHLRPTLTFKNCLPVPVICIVQGDVEEFTVQPGAQLQMPTVNPGHSYVVLKLVNYLEKEWSCKRDIVLSVPEFSVWQFDSHDSVAKMSLDLGLHCQDKSGTMIMSLYCPFWMLNKTGLMLSYRKSSKTEKNQSAGSPAKNSDETPNILHHPDYFKGPILFSFAAKNFFGKKKAAIRIKNGEWSDKFSLDVAGSSGMVVCKESNAIHQIGVHNQLTYNGLTKQVTFTPYFVLINNTEFNIDCQELERPADPWITVNSKACKSLWPLTERDDKLLKVRVSKTNDVTAPFLITEVQTTLLKLPNKYGGINVDVQITEGGVYITFTSYAPGLAPALIINHTTHDLQLWERESVNIRQLEQRHQFLHTWENPCGPRLLHWETSKKKDIEDDLRKDGLGEFSPTPDSHIYWVSFLDGMQRVLLFTEDMEIAKDAQSAGDLENIQLEVTISIHGVGVSIVNNEIRQEIVYIGIASSGIIWETCKFNSKRYKQLSVKDCAAIEAAYQQYILNEIAYADPIVIDPKMTVDFRNEMMVRPHKRRIRRAFQTGLWFQMKTSPNQLQLHAKINRVQIDNQVQDCIFPVILAPVPPPKSVAADNAMKPFAELSIVQRVMKHSSIQQFKYFKLLIQEFHIKIDLGFVNSMLTVFETRNPSEDDEAQSFIKDMSLVDEPLLAHVSTQSIQEQKNFYDLLHFSPLKIHVSFSLAAPSGGNSTHTASATPAFISVLLQGLGVTLTDMQDVVFRLAYFERDYCFLTRRQLTSEAISHYRIQAVKQLYVLVLGLDVIGNPYGLVLGLSKGVEDLFYEPFQGAIQGPGEFAEGLVLGVRSLFGHTVGGAAGAVSRITGAMGKGIAALTFDKDYQRKRRDQFNKKPANIREGVARGGKGLVMGVVDGVTGVFTKPISGAKEQGVEGFFKGLGKGAVGLVTRPTAGVIDFASGSLDAVKRATEMGDEVIRLRPPRFMRSDGLVRPYSKQEAEGHKLLVDLEKGKYANTDVYSYHLWIIERKDVLLLTDKRMAYIVHNDLFGGWQVEWAYTWTDIRVPAKVVDRGVQVMTGESKKKVLGLFGSGENGKIIILADPAQRELVKEKIEALRVTA